MIQYTNWLCGQESCHRAFVGTTHAVTQQWARALSSQDMQLKSDILNEIVGSLSVATSSDDPNNLEESSDPLHPIEAPPINMLDILLNGIDGDKTTPKYQVNTATANMLYENETYQLLLGNDFKMKIQNIEKKVCNCPLSWWKSSAHRFKNLERLAVKFLAIPATSAPSERIWSRAARVLTVK
jgi:hypothetical protein